LAIYARTIPALACPVKSGLPIPFINVSFR
jgi:hypothetical protein